MNAAALPMGSFIRMAKGELQAILDRLKQLGYRTIGPRLADGAIVYDDLESISQLPVGMTDEQDGGQYRLRQQTTPTYFDYVVGPHSLKNFLFPPRDVMLEYQRSHHGWQQRVRPGPLNHWPSSVLVPVISVPCRSSTVSSWRTAMRIPLTRNGDRDYSLRP